MKLLIFRESLTPGYFEIVVLTLQKTIAPSPPSKVYIPSRNPRKPRLGV